MFLLTFAMLAGNSVFIDVEADTMEAAEIEGRRILRMVRGADANGAALIEIIPQP